MAVNIVARIDDSVRIENVLVSVSDKNGIQAFVTKLVTINPEVGIYSTGGTYKAIAESLGAKAGQNLRRVSEYTGQPEMQGGLVKTLDYKVYLGLLSETYNQDHQDDMGRVGGKRFDMVVVNLYPFSETVAQSDVTPEKARANIDIGGPCMARAAAKNFLRVACLTDPGDYSVVMSEMVGSGGCVSLATRYRLAQKTFHHTASYDRAIAEYLIKTNCAAMANCYTLQNPVDMTRSDR